MENVDNMLVEVKELLAKDRFHSAFELLQKELIGNEVLLHLNMRYNSYQNKVNKGLISNEESSIEKNKILADLLEFLSQVTSEEKKLDHVSNSRRSNVFGKTFIFFIIGEIILIVLLWLSYQTTYLKDAGAEVWTYPILMKSRLILIICFSLLALYSIIWLVMKLFIRKTKSI